MTADVELRGAAGAIGAAARARHERLPGLDRLRGLAVLLMVLDHGLVVGGQAGNVLRFTVTRAAMPLFFLVAGSLVRRLTVRHVGVLGVGLVLPLAVPWVDRPNVLVWYVLGAALLVWGGRLGIRPVWWVLLALVVSANGYGGGWGPHSYEPSALVAFMALGSVGLDRLQAWGSRLPACLVWAGRWPLSTYVGHLVLLQLLVVSL